MDKPRKNKVSLRGASSEEISRDALLAKVSQERELRSYVRRANAAALYIQRVWRRYIVTKKTALWFQEEWEGLGNVYTDSMTANWISNCMLRPFFFFIRTLSIQRQQIQTRDIDCMQHCFKILLDSMNSNDPKCNFCSLAVAAVAERRTWTYQAQNLISLCSFLLTECNKCYDRSKDVNVVTSLALRIVVLLTDPKAWKSITEDNHKDAETAGKVIVQFLGNHKSGYYVAIRRYINMLNKHADNKLLITTSAITLALRPFQMTKIDIIDPGKLIMHLALEEYISLVLTIPWLIHSLPTVLIPALKHNSILSPCFLVLLISGEKILTKISETDRLEPQTFSKVIPPVGWALANVISFATTSENDFVDPKGTNEHMFYVSYVHVVATLAKHFLDWLENVGSVDNRVNLETSSDESETTEHRMKVSYLESLGPIYQQWHLGKLLAVSRKDSHDNADKSLMPSNKAGLQKLELVDIVYFYSYMLRIFGNLNPVVGPLPMLSMLSFSPGFIFSLWSILESILFLEKANFAEDTSHNTAKALQNKKDLTSDKKQKQPNRDGVNKWANVLNKFTSKSLVGHDHVNPVDDQPGTSQVKKELSDDVWDIKLLSCGPRGISKDLSCLLHLFCATYSHLLFVLDDIEFYEKQVPFLLEHQRRIASVLNTLVYNGLLHGVDHENRPLMDSAIRCLHLLYERDCRHPFCPSVLWLSPGRTSRPPIAVAARSHEVVSANDTSTSPSTVSVITITPHVFPFEERVQMFREFISMDKVSRKMAGEVDGLGSRSIDIVVRRGHVVEDGFRQLNSLGTKLKSAIHVSFVNESGLPEAGLDYGGLSKEFLTDISKQAFSPEYGLFSQTSTSDSLLIPNSSARHLENGVQMIEFLGRVVGKALYEGILLDYSFSHVFVQKLLGRYSFFDELSTLDPELYRNLIYVKHYDGDVMELSLDFTVTDESFGKRFVIELKPGGKHISVTNENKMQYVHAMADYKLNQQILLFSNAFYRGLTDLISHSWLKLFNAREFNQLLSGGIHDIDVDDLRNNAKYSGGYSESSRTIKIFWEVLKGFEPKERCMLLKFVTSCSRAPLLGFKYLQPTFTIHKVSCDTTLWAAIGGQDVERLPSASTCYNTLKLPTYKRASTLREKLLYAINSNAGFELS